jgi:hypothetical protein
MGPRLPIKKRWISTDKLGRTCIVEVDIEQTTNKSLYPPHGVKSVFKVKREKKPGVEDFEAVILIDNHEPFGFHEHPKLPAEHDYRKSIHISDWQDAWLEFEKRIEEILNET